MNLGYLIHIIVALLALTGIVPTLTYIAPIGLGPRHIPVITTAGAFACWYLPTGIDSALALVPLSAVLFRLLNVHVVPDTTADWSPAGRAVTKAGKGLENKVSSIKGTVKGKLVTVYQRVMRVAPTPEPPVTEFVKPDADFVLPADDTATPPADGAGDDEPDDLEPPAHVSTIRKFVPSLLD